MKTFECLSFLTTKGTCPIFRCERHPQW